MNISTLRISTHAFSRLSLSLWTLVLLALPVYSQVVSSASPRELEATLNTHYKNKILTLKSFDKSDVLRYTRSGSVIRVVDLGTWTLYSMVEIQEAEVERNLVRFHAKRIAVLFDPKTRKLAKFRTGVLLKIEIEIGDEAITSTEVHQALAKMFLTPSEDLADLVPDYWRDYLLRQAGKMPIDNGKQVVGTGEGKDGTGKAAAEKSSKPKKKITPPQLLSKTPPAYTLEARAAKHTGTVKLETVIAKDGSLQNIKILQPLGLGLDEASIEAVKLWRYTPLMLGDEAAEVVTTIDVNFTMSPR